MASQEKGTPPTLSSKGNKNTITLDVITPLPFIHIKENTTTGHKILPNGTRERKMDQKGDQWAKQMKDIGRNEQ